MRARSTVFVVPALGRDLPALERFDLSGVGVSTCRIAAARIETIFIGDFG